jgi:hypothetical protein
MSIAYVRDHWFGNETPFYCRFLKDIANGLKKVQFGQGLGRSPFNFHKLAFHLCVLILKETCIFIHLKFKERYFVIHPKLGLGQFLMKFSKFPIHINQV